MAYTLKVTNAKRDTVIVDGVDFIEVEFDILDGKKVIETRKQGFPLGTSEKEIKAVLTRYLSQFISEPLEAAKHAEKDALAGAADKTITSVANLEIQHETTLPKRKG